MGFSAKYRMRFHEIFDHLHEGRRETVWIGDGEVDAILDPNHAEFLAALQRAGGRLRGILNADRLWVWPARAATHFQMERALGAADPDYRLTLRGDRVLLDLPPDNEVRNSPSLRRAYGNDPFKVLGGV